jgi:hypothetical protein
VKRPDRPINLEDFRAHREGPSPKLQPGNDDVPATVQAAHTSMMLGVVIVCSVVIVLVLVVLALHLFA